VVEEGALIFFEKLRLKNLFNFKWGCLEGAIKDELGTNL
jgi:hypothetical protein